MLYTYRCKSCSNEFDYCRPAREYNAPAECPNCHSSDSELMITGGSGFFGEKVEQAEYNPGLGCITKSKAHRAEIAKRKNLVEIGNDAIPSKMIDTEIADRETKIERSWDATS